MNSEPALQQLVARFGERWNAFDAAGLAALFAPDADMTNAFGIAATGRDAIARFHTAIFAGPFKGSEFHVETTRLRHIRDDVVMVDLRWAVTGMAPRGERPADPLNGLMAMVVTRDEGQWTITTMHVMQFPPGKPSV